VLEIFADQAKLMAEVSEKRDSENPEPCEQLPKKQSLAGLPRSNYMVMTHFKVAP